MTAVFPDPAEFSFYLINPERLMAGPSTVRRSFLYKIPSGNGAILSSSSLSASTLYPLPYRALVPPEPAQPPACSLISSETFAALQAPAGTTGERLGRGGRRGVANRGSAPKESPAGRSQLPTRLGCAQAGYMARKRG